MFTAAFVTFSINLFSLYAICNGHPQTPTDFDWHVNTETEADLDTDCESFCQRLDCDQKNPADPYLCRVGPSICKCFQEITQKVLIWTACFVSGLAIVAIATSCYKLTRSPSLPSPLVPSDNSRARIIEQWPPEQSLPIDPKLWNPTQNLNPNFDSLIPVTNSKAELDKSKSYAPPPSYEQCLSREIRSAEVQSKK